MTELWITAKVVRDLFHQHGERNDRKNMVRIAERAALGSIRTKAEKARMYAVGSPQGIAADFPEGGPLHEFFWQGPVLKIDWITGDVVGGAEGSAKAVAQRVSFYQADILALFDQPESAPSSLSTTIGKGDCDSPDQLISRGGRKKGVGGYAKYDRPLIERMRALLETGEAASPWDAARRVAADARGSPTNAQRRLTEGYKEIYPNDE